MPFPLSFLRRWLRWPVRRRAGKAPDTPRGRRLFCRVEELEPRVLLANQAYLVPGLAGDTAQVLRDIASRWGDSVLVSLMRQYTPFDMQDYPELDRTITAEEYADACTLFGELGLGGFFQQDESISESFIPAFDGTGLEEN